MDDPVVTVHSLRRAWKPHKERLVEVQSGHLTPIRFHRACSWLQRVEELDSDDDLDLVLTCRWIAFNALYGVWDEQQREPKLDRESWRAYLDRILALDQGGVLSEMLEANRRLVMSLLEDEYLSNFFWQDPTDKRASQSRKVIYDARTWYQQGQMSMILERSVERIYLTGGYPRILDQKLNPSDWLQSYVATYIERDVRTISNVCDLVTFQRFVERCAGRTSQLLNYSSLASDCGIAQPTAKTWMSVLETSFLAHRLPSFSGNIRKRLIKMPKLHFYDSGLVCWLLGIRNVEQLRSHPLRGAIFETWVVSEILKHRMNIGE